VGYIGSSDFSKRHEAILEGEKAALDRIAQNQGYTQSDLKKKEDCNRLNFLGYMEDGSGRPFYLRDSNPIFHFSKVSKGMEYEGIVIRPPSEAESLILQVTLGCSHNRCTFCPTYKGRRFRIKELER